MNAEAVGMKSVLVGDGKKIHLSSGGSWVVSGVKMQATICAVVMQASKFQVVNASPDCKRCISKAAHLNR